MPADSKRAGLSHARDREDDAPAGLSDEQLDIPAFLRRQTH
jgi:hypothetical protein